MSTPLFRLFVYHKEKKFVVLIEYNAKIADVKKEILKVYNQIVFKSNDRQEKETTNEPIRILSYNGYELCETYRVVDVLHDGASITTSDVSKECLKSSIQNHSPFSLCPSHSLCQMSMMSPNMSFLNNYPMLNPLQHSNSSRKYIGHLGTNHAVNRTDTFSDTSGHESEDPLPAQSSVKQLISVINEELQTLIKSSSLPGQQSGRKSTPSMLLEVDLPDSSLEQTHDTVIPDEEMDNKDNQKTTDIQGKQDSVLTLSADDAQEHTLNEDSPKKKHKHKHKHSKKKKAKHVEKEKTTDTTEMDVYEFTEADNFPPPAKIKKKTKKYSSIRSEGTGEKQSQLSSHADVRKRKETQSLEKLTPEETRKHKKRKKNKTSKNSCDHSSATYTQETRLSKKKTIDNFTSAKVDRTSTCKLTSQSTDELNYKGVEDYTMNDEMKKDENGAKTKQPTNLLKPLDDLSSDWSSDDTDAVVKQPIKASKTKPQKPNLRSEISLSSSPWSSEDETEEQDTSVLQTSKEIKKKEEQAKDVQRNEQSNDFGNDSSDNSSEEEDNVVIDKDNNTSEDKGSFEREKVNTDNSVQEHDIKTDHDEQKMGDEQVENKSDSVSSKENTITVHVQEEDSMNSDVTLSSGFTKSSSCNSSIEESNSKTQRPLRIAAQTANVTNMYVMAYNDSNVIEDSDSDEDYDENDISSQQKLISKKSSHVKSLKSNPKLQRSVRKPLRAISPASNLQDLYKKVINSNHTQNDINVNMDCVIGEEEKPLSQDLFEDQVEKEQQTYSKMSSENEILRQSLGVDEQSNEDQLSEVIPIQGDLPQGQFVSEQEDNKVGIKTSLSEDAVNYKSSGILLKDKTGSPDKQSNSSQTRKRKKLKDKMKSIKVIKKKKRQEEYDTPDNVSELNYSQETIVCTSNFSQNENPLLKMPSLKKYNQSLGMKHQAAQSNSHLNTTKQDSVLSSSDSEVDITKLRKSIKQSSLNGGVEKATELPLKTPLSETLDDRDREIENNTKEEATVMNTADTKTTKDGNSKASKTSSTSGSSSEEEEEDEENIQDRKTSKHSSLLQALAIDANDTLSKVRQKTSTMVPPNSKIHKRLLKKTSLMARTPLLSSKHKAQMRTKPSTPLKTSSSSINKPFSVKNRNVYLNSKTLEGISREEEETAINLSQQSSNLSQILDDEKYW